MTHPELQEALLPHATVQCHAANLVQIDDQTLGCTWFGGTQEGLPDISIWFSRRRHDGPWTQPVLVSNDSAKSEQNPVPFVASSSEVWVFYTAQTLGSQDTAEIRLAVSSDAGDSWVRREIDLPNPSGHGMFVRQPPVRLNQDKLALPVFCCPTPEQGPWVGDDDYSAVMITPDEGRTWSFHPVPGSTGCVHMNILPRPDGSYIALYRRRQADAIYASFSEDGVQWSHPAPTELPNNNSSIQAALLDDGRFALAYNHSSRDDATQRRTSLYDDLDAAGQPPSVNPGRAFWGAPRAPMSIATSEDGGLSWFRCGNIEEGDGYCLTNNSSAQKNRELSYPSILQAKDGSIQLAYTHHRQAIKNVRINPGWLEHT